MVYDPVSLMVEGAPRKIALMGTSSVGKTTTLDAAAVRFPQAQIVPEAARAFFTANPHVTDRFSVDAQGQIQMMALQSEMHAMEGGAKVIFTDRSVLDAVVYTRENGDPEGAETLFDRIKYWLPTYHRFLLLDPADVPYEQDDIRTEPEEKRNSFHRVFVEFFREKGIPFELLSGAVEQRLARLQEILDEE